MLPDTDQGQQHSRKHDINKVKDMADLQMYQMKALRKRSKM